MCSSASSSSDYVPHGCVVFVVDVLFSAVAFEKWELLFTMNRRTEVFLASSTTTPENILRSINQRMNQRLVFPHREQRCASLCRSSAAPSRFCVGRGTKRGLRQILAPPNERHCNGWKCPGAYVTRRDGRVTFFARPRQPHRCASPQHKEARN